MGLAPYKVPESGLQDEPYTVSVKKRSKKRAREVAGTPLMPDIGLEPKYIIRVMQTCPNATGVMVAS